MFHMKCFLRNVSVIVIVIIVLVILVMMTLGLILFVIVYRQVKMNVFVICSSFIVSGVFVAAYDSFSLGWGKASPRNTTQLEEHP